MITKEDIERIYRDAGQRKILLHEEIDLCRLGLWALEAREALKHYRDAKKISLADGNYEPLVDDIPITQVARETLAKFPGVK